MGSAELPASGGRMGAATKRALVEELSAKLQDSRGILLADYRGLKVRQMGELRRRLREAQADMSVVKNTLLRLALALDPTVEFPWEMLEGPTAVIFCRSDVVTAAKALTAFSKEHRLPVLKGGHIEGRAIDASQAQELATLPSRQELIAQLAHAVAAPRQLLVSGLQAVVSRLVGTLEAFAKKNP